MSITKVVLTFKLIHYFQLCGGEIGNERQPIPIYIVIMSSLNAEVVIHCIDIRTLSLITQVMGQILKWGQILKSLLH